jgi:uncharacterized membrane protein
VLLKTASDISGLLTVPDLNGLFGLVCGQNPDHTWAPAGVLLPCCHRCLGLYVGAGLALLLHLLLRPKLTGRFLECHGAFLLLMVPLGFHWVPQEPVVRTLSGLLFGAGVATFLWLPVAERLPHAALAGAKGSWGGVHPGYATGVLGSAVLLLLLAEEGGRAAADVLSFAAFAGLLSLAAVATANLLLGTQGAARLMWRLVRRRVGSPTGS